MVSTTQATNRAIIESPHGFGHETDAKEVVSKFASLIAGKTILITGVASGGLGGETSIALAAASPARLILSARSASRAQPIADQITSSYPSVKTTILEVDLGSLASVRKAAREVEGGIDVLINNAGVMATPYAKTEDGFESQFGINHLGPFVFTNTLLREGKVKEGGRVVNVSSDGHRLGGIRWDDPGFKDGAEYNRWEAYGQGKSANILFSVELARRLKAKNILSFSLHPGVMNTNLGRHFGEDGLDTLKAQDTKVGYGGWEFRFKTLSQGCATHVVAAFDPTISGYNGSYLEDCTIFKTLQPWVQDPEDAKKLWTFSEELVGEKFDL
jgi:NAD(P)-dependent dehydrogenase (short-subunit alcohol dehydrogenase family)